MATNTGISTRRVLIVDDSGTMRPMADSILSFRADFEIVGHANTVSDALAMIQQMRPDIVTIDLRMPYIDGSRLLGALERLDHLHKIVISSWETMTSAIEQKLGELGAAAFFDRQEIARDPEHFRAALARLAPRVAPRPMPTAARSNVIQAAHRFPLPWDEAQRLSTLVATDMLNLDPDPRLDVITQNLARSTGYPVAIINLIGVDDVWIKSAVGIDRGVVARSEAICAHTICQDGALVVTKAHQNALFRDLPSVAGAPGIRTYIGVPIVSDAHICLGTVCICDTDDRSVSETDIAAVTNMARMASDVLQPTISRHAA